MLFLSQLQRLLGVCTVHCCAHRLNLIIGDGLSCVDLPVKLNMLSQIINTDSFALHMLAAQAEQPSVSIVKLRYVSFFAI